MSIAEAQTLLAPGEALLSTVYVPEVSGVEAEVYAWLITNTTVRWVKLPLAPPEIHNHVKALRCGLDNTMWGDATKFEQCVTLLGKHRYDTARAKNVLPFDLARAHALYRALLGPFEDLIKGKHLLIVPSGGLTQLPFHVLVTQPPDVVRQGAPAEAWVAPIARPSANKIGARGADKQGLTPHRVVAWLARSHAVTILPAVSSLKACAASVSRAPRRSR